MSEQLTPTQRVELLRNKPHGTLPLDWYLLSLELATELERVKEQLEIEQGRETCNGCSRLWNPSLIESGTCIFCLYDAVKDQRDVAQANYNATKADNDQLKRQVEELKDADSRVRYCISKKFPDQNLDSISTPALVDQALDFVAVKTEQKIRQAIDEACHE